MSNRKASRRLRTQDNPYGEFKYEEGFELGSSVLSQHLNGSARALQGADRDSQSDLDNQMRNS